MPQAIKHFTVAQIEAFIDGGDEGLVELLVAAIEEAKKASDGVATVQFFIDYEPEEEDEAEEG